MTPDHSIRLHGPWQLSLWTTCEDGGSPPRIEAAGRFTAPAGLAERLPADYRGPVRLERSFHRPTGLRTDSRVQLRIDTNLAGQLSLNGQALGQLIQGENRCDITQALQTRNRLCLEVAIDASPSIGQPICDVRLEIFA